MARRHLAIFLKKGGAEKILSGEKTVEIRLSQSRIVPYGKVTKDDEVYLKDAGGLILGSVEIDNVLFYDHLTPEMIANIRREYSEAMQIEDSFWQTKVNCHYATIIFLKNPHRFLAAPSYKKHDRRGWVVIEENLS